MIKEKMIPALNKQINAELYSWYLYLAMSAHFERINFPGVAKWLRLQAQEEMSHAMKILDFLNTVNAHVVLDKIDTPPVEWKSHLEAFQQIFDHEVHVTDLIDKLVDLALAEKDHATYNFLQWFVNEQVEEVATADTLLQKVKFIGDSHNGLFMLDHDLAKRV